MHLVQFKSVNSIIVHWVSMSGSYHSREEILQPIDRSVVQTIQCRVGNRNKIIISAMLTSKSLSLLFRCECTCYIIFTSIFISLTCFSIAIVCAWLRFFSLSLTHLLILLSSRSNYSECSIKWCEFFFLHSNVRKKENERMSKRIDDNVGKGSGRDYIKRCSTIIA